MATIPYYVDARNGNDSNDALTWGTAVKTLGGLNTAQTAQGDFGSLGNLCPIHCVGVFTEFYSTQTRYNAYQADGFAILDGEGTIDKGLYSVSTQQHTVTGFVFKNHTLCSVYCQSNGGISFIDCTFDEPYATFGGLYILNYASWPAMIKGCTFQNCIKGLTGGVEASSYYAIRYVYNCTFANNTYGIWFANVTAAIANYPVEIKNCIFRSNTTHINLTGTVDTIGNHGTLASNGGRWNLNYNDIDFSSGNCKEFVENTAITTYTSLATWQTITTANNQPNTPDPNSISTDPLLVDEAKNLYGLTAGSPCLVNGSIVVGSLIQGAWDEYPMEGISNNRNPLLWTGATFTNTEIDADNNIVLSTGQTNGTVVFEYDFGAQRIIKKFTMDFLYGWNTSVPTYDPAATLPEVWSFRVRTSPDAVPTWGAYSEVDWNSGGVDLNLSNVYVIGIEITIRNNA
jgi:hypothetical protein